LANVLIAQRKAGVGSVESALTATSAGKEANVAISAHAANVTRAHSATSADSVANVANVEYNV